MLRTLDEIADRSRVNDFVLKLFWNPENDNETIGDLKATIRKKYEREGNIRDLLRCEKFYQKKQQ